MVAANRTIGGLEILAPVAPAHDAVLSPPALELVADLARRFGGRVEELLARRRERQARFDAGERPQAGGRAVPGIMAARLRLRPSLRPHGGRRAEISRTQVWQWIHHRATLDDGRPLTVERFRSVLSQEMDGLARSVGQSRFDAGRFREAGALFDRMSTSAVFEEFLTLPAYDSLP